MRRLPLFAALLALPAGVAGQSPAPQTAADSTRRILVGVEYVLIDRPLRTAALARELAPVGFTTIKHYAEHAEWGAMQPAPLAPINFSRLDAYVREFQAIGIRELVVCLRSASPWGSKHAPKLRPRNLAPKPEHLAAYERWIAAVVERYDGDGTGDMRGLRFPVRYYEIGSELSSYEPEPVEEYLTMLERAYRAAHRAFPGVIVAHAALLTTTAFRGRPGPGGYESAFAAMPPRIAEHGLADIRKLLDRPELFDVLNVHSLGDPSEIEDLLAWLSWETARRGYRKPVIISDTATTPWIAWGNATSCTLPPAQLGIVVAPATEADRCRLAAYFTRLVAGDPETVRWTQGYAGADNVKRVVIAAEQGAALINTAFLEDLTWFKLKPLGAGTGPSAWAGLIDPARRERRAGYFALQQLMTHLQGLERVTRVAMTDRSARVYEISGGGTRRWVAWLDPGTVLLPGDSIPSTTVALRVALPEVTVEPLIVGYGQSVPQRRRTPAPGGLLNLVLTPDPVFVLEP